MATVIDSLIVTLGLDPRDFEEGQKRAGEAFLKTKEAAQRHGKDVEEAGDQMADAINRVTFRVLELFAAITGSRALADFASKLTTADAVLGRFASALGESPQRLNAWENAAERFGGSAGATASTLEAVNKQLFDLNHNGQALPTAFSQLQAWTGMSINPNQGLDKYLTDVSAALQRLHQTDPSSAHNIAQQLGIDAGTEQLMYAMGSDIDNYLSKLEKSLSPSDKAIQAAQQLYERWVALKQEAIHLGNVIMERLGPVLVDIIDKMSRWIDKNGEWINQRIVGAITDLADALPGIASNIDRIAQAFGGWSRVIWTVVGAFAALKALEVGAMIATVASALGAGGAAAGAVAGAAGGAAAAGGGAAAGAEAAGAAGLASWLGLGSLATAFIAPLSMALGESDLLMTDAERERRDSTNAAIKEDLDRSRLKPGENVIGAHVPVPREPDKGTPAWWFNRWREGTPEADGEAAPPLAPSLVPEAAAATSLPETDRGSHAWWMRPEEPRSQVPNIGPLNGPWVAPPAPRAEAPQASAPVNPPAPVPHITLPERHVPSAPAPSQVPNIGPLNGPWVAPPEGARQSESTPTINGAPVSQSNPLPVKDVREKQDKGGFWSDVWDGVKGALGITPAAAAVPPSGSGPNASESRAARTRHQSLRPSAGVGKWWTPERQAHAYERLVKEAQLSDAGARGLVARWSAVEARGGPTSANNIGGGHYGIAQWGPKRSGVWGNPDFDDQLSYAIKELNGSERRAGDYLRRAQTDQEGATGASMYERAEGYNAGTGRDNFTGQTQRSMPSIETGAKVSALSTSAAIHPPTNSNTSNEMHIQNLHVNTQATDAKGIAADIDGALKRQLVSAQANYGLA